MYSPTGQRRSFKYKIFKNNNTFSGKRSQRTAACKSSGAKPFHTFRQNDLCKTAAFKKRTISDYFQCFRKYNFLKIFKIRKTLLSNGSNSLFYYNFSYRIPYCNPLDEAFLLPDFCRLLIDCKGVNTPSSLNNLQISILEYR